MQDQGKMNSGPSGLEQIRAILADPALAPSMARTLNFALVEVEPDRVVFRGTPTADFLNPLGVVHGGWAAAILDSALGVATHVTLAPGELFTTLELKVNLTRAIRPDGPALSATGRCITRGRRVAVTEATLTDEAGKVYAHGTSTCMIMPPGSTL
ncbi:PaaI family thioesterase [Acuticoccus sp. I52.16.1]|uniref:PaaI family thioesterase n=1 Tax=Acuticoccus sp. I52.16.1 TaxID=2928472 RepID=UPI001FD05A7D|nr:PaaI family thioesterase [Acuticoccus sp. I52.16.1]UOM35865.1 PaaI family thioesterase [Acuticoccus sp. I52.16.1]